MAKQAVGTIERHLEKGILGVTVLLLFAAVAKFLIISPNKASLQGGEVVTPGDIDDKLLEHADRVRTAVLAAKPDAKTTDAQIDIDGFKNSLDPVQFASLPVELPRGVGFLPTVPMFSTVVAVNVELVKPLPLPKPVLAVGRSCMAVEEPYTWAPEMKEDDLPVTTDKEYSQPANWVTVSAVWNRARQVEANSAYAKGRQYALLGGIEAQRRAMRSDGSWSDDDWQTIKPYERATLPETPQFELTAGKDGKLAATAESLQAAGKLFNLLQDPIVQMNLLRPIAPAPACGDMWTYPVIEGSDPLAQDDEFFWPEVQVGYKMSPATLQDRYPRTAEEWKKRRPPWIDDRRPTEEEIDNWKTNFPLAEAAYVKAIAEGDETVESTANNYVVLCHDMTLDPACKAAALKLLDKFTALAEKKPRQAGARPPLPPGKQPQAEREYIPHPQSEIQQVWVIDGVPGSVVGGQTYQYRIRPLLFNPYFGQPQSLKNTEDAKVPFIRGEWSEPSDPITIEPDTQFFAKSAAKESGKITFDMFKWYDGVWVKGNFKLAVGDLVGGQAKCQVSQDAKPLIDFSTEALILDLDFERPWCGRARAGARFNAPQPTESIVLVDASGNVTERIVDLDKATPKSKEIAAKVYQPPKKKEETVTAPPQGGRGAQPGRGLQGMGYGDPRAMEEKERERLEKESQPKP